MDKVICLACGGVATPDAPLAPGETRCTCPPVSSAHAEHEANDTDSAGSLDVAAESTSIVCPSCGHDVDPEDQRCEECGALIAAKRCPWCLAWNLSDAPTCRRCQRPLSAETSSESIKCPHCHVPLQPTSALDLKLHECPDCGGVFLTPSMLQVVLQAGANAQRLRLALPKRQLQAPPPQTPATRVSYIPCPVCGQIMNRKMFGRFSGVVVDVCAQHGMWFDPSELRTVLQFIEEGGLNKLRARQEQEKKDQRHSEAAAAAVEPIAATTQQMAAARLSGPFGPPRDTSASFVLALIDLWRNR